MISSQPGCDSVRRAGHTETHTKQPEGSVRVKTVRKAVSAK